MVLSEETYAMSKTQSSGKPYLSIIIPAYNAHDTLPRLLASLSSSTFADFEVIVGDDHSQLPYTNISSAIRVGKRNAQVTIIRLKQNIGPAAARNAAAARARGRVLVFLDSDVEVYPDTLENIAKKFKKDRDLTALTGVWDKTQYSSDFFPQYKALRDWSYWTNERDRDGYYYLFSTRIAALKRDVFERLGGFNEQFRQMEDVEITYRIARRYAIIFAPDVRVHHEFEPFLPIARKYFWRSFYWTMLYNERKKFDPVATTRWESLAALTGFGTVSSLVGGSFVYFILPFDWVKTIFVGFAAVMLFFHFILLRKFLVFVAGEKGILFAARALLTGLVIYSFVVCGAGYALVKRNLQ